MAANGWGVLGITAAALLAACGDTGREPVREEAAGPAEERVTDASLLWREAPPAPLDDTARYDTAWRTAPSVDSIFMGIDAPVLPADSAALALPALPDSMFDSPERWEDLGADSVWADPATGRALHLPLGGRVAGPSVLRAQVLLDRAGFSPGVLDGRWGGNVERAVFWFQRREGLRPTGRIDSVTLERLQAAAGPAAPEVATRVLSPEDLEGPFTDIPADVYERADLECLCPESALEQIAARAHTTPDVVRQLNPRADFDALAPGDSLRVPVVGAFAATDPTDSAATDPADSAGTDPADSAAAAPGATVQRIVISDRGRYLHAFDASGRLLFHFPATLGSEYNPSPEGRLEVTSVTFNPWFHYQPDLLEGVDPDDPSVRLPPGPNSPVGTVWIALSREHYGIHGTSAPETIGYVTSSGCVRLTNWDAELLGRHLSPGTVVEFRDIRR